MWEGRERGASDRILSYYSYLFGFPSHGVLLLEQVAVTLAGGALLFLLSRGTIILPLGIFFALSTFTFPSLLSDLLVFFLLRGDQLCTPRRCTALSLATFIPWIALLIFFSMAARLTGNTALIPRGFMLGFSLSLALRFLVLSALSSRGFLKTLLSSVVQPFACLIGALVLLPIDNRSLLLGSVASLSLLSGVWIIIRTIERWRCEQEDLRLLPLFRAFLQAWSEGINEPLEGYLEMIGEEADLPVNSLIFRARGQNKGALIVPYIHSGPFRNVGSSALPILVKEELGKELGCEVLFLHGISTHDRDLASQRQNHRVIQALLDEIGGGVEAGLASPMVRTSRGGATATCQLFGDQALVALTVSPKSVDDLPQRLEAMITEAGRALGLETMVVDLHNSLDEDDELSDEDVSNLYEAALEAMRRALRAPRTPLRVGFSRVIPHDFSPVDGMGPTGIGVLAADVQGQTCVYVVIDGNNMVSGLREVLLSALKELGVDEPEVATTDTHFVNALSVSPRGYYTVGERMDWGRITWYVKESAAQALESLEPASFSFRRVGVRGLRIIGEDGLTYLGDVLEKGFRLFKRSSLSIIPPLGALSFFLLFL